MVSKRSKDGKERKLTLYLRITHCIAPRFLLFWIYWLHTAIHVISRECVYDNQHHVNDGFRLMTRHHAHIILLLSVKMQTFLPVLQHTLHTWLFTGSDPLLSTRCVLFLSKKATLHSR